MSFKIVTCNNETYKIKRHMSTSVIFLMIYMYIYRQKELHHLLSHLYHLTCLCVCVRACVYVRVYGCESLSSFQSDGRRASAKSKGEEEKTHTIA